MYLNTATFLWSFSLFFIYSIKAGLEIGGGPGANDHLKLRRAP